MIIIIIKIESALQGQEKVRTLSIRKPQPHTTNKWKEEKEKILGGKKRSKSRLSQQETIGAGLKTRQSHTI